MKSVKGAQCKLTFDIDFSLLADLLEMEIEEVRESWDNGKLENLISQIDILELLEVVDLEMYSGIRVGSGYLG